MGPGPGDMRLGVKESRLPQATRVELGLVGFRIYRARSAARWLHKSTHLEMRSGVIVRVFDGGTATRAVFVPRAQKRLLRNAPRGR